MPEWKLCIVLSAIIHEDPVAEVVLHESEFLIPPSLNRVLFLGGGFWTWTKALGQQKLSETQWRKLSLISACLLPFWPLSLCRYSGSHRDWIGYKSGRKWKKWADFYMCSHFIVDCAWSRLFSGISHPPSWRLFTLACCSVFQLLLCPPQVQSKLRQPGVPDLELFRWICGKQRPVHRQPADHAGNP